MTAAIFSGSRATDMSGAVGTLLLRGMLVGVFAGLLAFGFARIFGEPEVARAIAFEQKAGHGHHDHSGAAVPAHTHEAEPELVSRETQAGLGLFTGIVTFGAAIGGLFALVFAFVQGRVGRLGVRATAALLALAGFVALVLVPGLKYPANPPAVGNADTIGVRTGLYFLMLAISLGATALATLLAQRLSGRLGAWNAGLAAAAFFVVAVGAAYAALPSVDEVPEHFSAALLWRFRMASWGIQAVLWATIGLVFGALTERSLAAGFAGDGRQGLFAR